MAEQSYELMHKDDVVASLQLDDLSGAILKVTPGANPELLPLGGSQGADSLRKWWLRRAVPISQGNIAALLQQEGIPSARAEPRSQSVRPLLDQAERQRTDVERRQSILQCF